MDHYCLSVDISTITFFIELQRPWLSWIKPTLEMISVKYFLLKRKPNILNYHFHFLYLYWKYKLCRKFSYKLAILTGYNIITDSCTYFNSNALLRVIYPCSLLAISSTKLLLNSFTRCFWQISSLYILLDSHQRFL